MINFSSAALFKNFAKKKSCDDEVMKLEFY